MFRRLFPVLTVILLLIADTSVVPILSPGWLHPLLSFTAVLTFGLLLGRTRGALYGIIAGFLIDVTASLPFGLMTVMYALGGFTAGFAGRKLRRNLFSTVLAPALCLFLYEAAMLGYSALAGSDFYAAQLGRAGVRILINTALVQVEYLVFNAVCKPHSARYEMR